MSLGNGSIDLAYKPDYAAALNSFSTIMCICSYRTNSHNILIFLNILNHNLGASGEPKVAGAAEHWSSSRS